MRAAQMDGAPGARALALVHVAMADAINTVENRHTRYAYKLERTGANYVGPAGVPSECCGVLCGFSSRRVASWTRRIETA